MKLSRIISFLEESKIEFQFTGNENYCVEYPYTGSADLNSFNYTMSNSYDSLECGLLISKNIIKDNKMNIIVTKNAKYVFYHIVSRLFSTEDYSEIKSKNELQKNNVLIGYNSIIHKHVSLGNDIIIFDSTVIGRAGFSYYTINGEKQRLKPFGSVIIKDNVNISSNVNIDRGNIGNTVLNENVVIDSLVHIAHDVVIGKNTVVTAGVIFSGYVTIGENCFIGVNSSFKNGISIGDNVTVGMSANVTKSFGDNLVLVGNPAKIFAHKCECGNSNIIRSSNYICNCGLSYNVTKKNVVKIL